MDLFNEFKTWSNYDKMVKSGCNSKNKAILFLGTLWLEGHNNNRLF